VVEGQLVYHQAKTERAGPTRQGSQVNSRGSHVADGRILVLDKEVVAIPELLSLLGFTDMRFVDLYHRRELLHLEGTEGVEYAKFELTHRCLTSMVSVVSSS